MFYSIFCIYTLMLNWVLMRSRRRENMNKEVRNARGAFTH